MAILTQREREVLALAAEGLANDEIEHRLCISRQAVRNHFMRIYDKFKLPDGRADASRVKAVLRYLRGDV